MRDRSVSLPSLSVPLRALAVLACLAGGSGCESVTGLDDLQLEPLPPACEGCDGRCVSGRCCRHGGTLSGTSVAGGQVAKFGRFSPIVGGGPLEAVFVNTGSNDVWMNEIVDGNLDVSPRFVVATPPFLRAIASLTDLDGDGWTDLATSHYDPSDAMGPHSLALHRRTADGWDAPKLFDHALWPDGLTAYDFDGDGLRDLRVEYNPPPPVLTHIGLRRNLGGFDLGPIVDLVELNGASFGSRHRFAPVRGTFPLGGEAVLLIADTARLEIPAAANHVQVVELDLAGVVPKSGGLADLDGDGDDDILIVSRPFGERPNSLLSYLRTGTAELELCESIPVPGVYSELDHLIAGDYDEDGHPDLLGIDSVNELFPPSKVEHAVSRYHVVRSVFP